MPEHWELLLLVPFILVLLYIAIFHPGHSGRCANCGAKINKTVPTCPTCKQKVNR